jgi:transcriptional regulator with XRE-family HTH domain
METNRKFIINNKIKQVLLDNRQTASSFADTIGVQRSTISHILAYRNRPSSELIQRITREYPKYTYDWFFNDDIEANDFPIEDTDNQQVGLRQYNKIVAPKLDKTKFVHDTPSTTHVAGLRGPRKMGESVVPTQNKRVVRVMIFYADHTCESFDSL